MELTFCSSNKSKYVEFAQCLTHPYSVTWTKLEIPEIQGSIEEIVTNKAEYAFNALNKPVLVEDTALGFAALNGLPGQYIKTFISKLPLNNVYKLLDGFDDKTATATTVIGYHDGTRVHVFRGDTKGKIVEPRGTTTFGWDPIFMPENHDLTYAELSKEEKNKISHRSKAINALKQYLENSV